MVNDIKILKCDKRWKRFLLLGVSAVLTGLTVVFPQIGLLAWISLIPAGIVIFDVIASDGIRARGVYGYGFFFFACYFAVIFHWFVDMYPLDFIDGMTPAAAIFICLAGCIGLSCFQAAIGGFAFVLIRLLFRTHVLTRFKYLRPFCVAGIWAIHEWSQTLGWWGVPWGRLPMSQTNYVAGLQTASLFGSYFVSFVLVAVNMCAAYLLLHAFETSARKVMICAVSAMLVFQYGMGALLYFLPNDGEETVCIAAIQGNISSIDRWSEESTKETLDVYWEYTRRAANEGADVVVWPETAMPWTFTEGSSYFTRCSALARETGVVLLVGAFTAGEDGELYNSMICFNPDGSVEENIYLKRRLVPFGEFAPFRQILEVIAPPLSQMVRNGEDLSAGERSEVFDTDKARVGSIICYDQLFENVSLDATAAGAQLITVSSNDSWFASSAVPYMNNAQSQLRAVENGRYVIRAANTGLTTVINSKGEVVETLPMLEKGMIVSEVQLNSNKTLYTSTGNVFILLLTVLFVGILSCEMGMKIYKRRKEI